MDRFFVVWFLGSLLLLGIMFVDIWVTNDTDLCLIEIAKEVCEETGIQFNDYYGGELAGPAFYCLDNHRKQTEMYYTNEEIERCENVS